jgi:hypothetical protein
MKAKTASTGISGLAPSSPTLYTPRPYSAQYSPVPVIDAPPPGSERRVLPIPAPHTAPRAGAVRGNVIVAPLHPELPRERLAHRDQP